MRWLIPLLLIAGPLCAVPDDDDLTAVLSEQSEIATKSKLNADYVPGILTVLEGDLLEDLGFQNVREALQLVPGVQTEVLNNGRRVANDNFFALPVQQVERIEMIRGPGAAVYDEVACSGVIHLITRKSAKRLVGNLAEYQNQMGGQWTQVNQRGVKTTVNAVREATDGATLVSGRDQRARSQPAVSFAPGFTNEDERLSSVSANRDEFDGAATRLINLILSHELARKITAFARLRDVGDRARQPNDPRPALEGYTTLDLDVVARDVHRKGLTLRYGLKNVFDTDARAPSVPRTHLDDLPRPGRTWWSQLALKF